MSVLSHQHVSVRTTRVLEDLFIFLYSEALLNETERISRKFCCGCIFDNLSQTKHDCMVLSLCEKVHIYFDCVLHRLKDDDVLSRWETLAKYANVPSEEYMAYKQNISCPVWREQDFKTDQWKPKLFQTTAKMAKLKERLQL